MDRIVETEQTASCVEWLFEWEDIVTGRKWTERHINKVVQGGLDNLAALLIGEVNSATAVTHVVWGSNDTAALITDTLTNITEVGRKAATTKTRTNGLARLRFFLGSTEGNGDHECFGLIARGTDTAGTGTLLNRLVRPFSKTSAAVLTIEVRWNNTGVST